MAPMWNMPSSEKLHVFIFLEVLSDSFEVFVEILLACP